MAARLGARSRMEEARGQARRVVGALGAEARTLVAGFAREVTAESGFESDVGRVEAAIDQVAPREEPADPAAALARVTTLLRGRPHPAIVLIGDGA